MPVRQTTLEFGGTLQPGASGGGSTGATGPAGVTGATGVK